MALEKIYRKCGSSAYKCRICTITAAVCLLFLSVPLLYRDDDIIRPLLNDASIVCNEPLRQNRNKVASYEFPDLKQYSDLFSGPTYREEVTIPSVPVFISAFSSNHFDEGLELVNNINTVVRKNFPHLKLIIYDIGLSDKEKQKLLSECKCEVIVFPFSRFPEWVQQIPTYTFKPLSIQNYRDLNFDRKYLRFVKVLCNRAQEQHLCIGDQLVVQEHPFIMWIDTSIRFTTSDLQPLFDRARKHGVLISRVKDSIAKHTHPSTFEFLKEEPCTFRNASELQGGFQVIYAIHFVRDYYLRPLVSCALSLGCIVPDLNSRHLLDCGHHGNVYHDCHRFDQSLVGILVYRLYMDNIDEHVVGPDFITFAKP